MSKTIQKNDNANSDDDTSFKEHIGELESENDLLKAEIATLQRLIWRNFEDLIDNAQHVFIEDNEDYSSEFKALQMIELVQISFCEFQGFSY